MGTLSAKKLQRRYRTGERHFAGVDLSGESLRGMNFTGINLAGANLSNTDIRGTNFTEANLQGAQLTKAKAGVQRRWLVPQLLIAFALAALSSFLLGALWVVFASSIISPSGDTTGTIAGDITLGVLGIAISLGFLALMYTRGFLVAVGAALGAVAFAIAGAVVFAFAGAFAVAFAGAFAVVFAFAGAFAVAFAGAFAVAFAGAFAVAVAVAAAAVVAGAGAGAKAAIIAISMLGLIINSIVYFLISRRALKGDPRDSLIRNIAVWFSGWGGTKFVKASLTDASFEEAILKSTHFYQANLTRTNFHLAKKVNLSRLGKTILADFQVQDLLLYLRGGGKSYVGLNLQGAYLVDADLADANFTEADLSQANLTGATLERTNFTKTQALGTNFQAAILTGATLEAWNIDSTTNLENAICGYVYLLSNHQERRPSSGNFGPGEFTKLFQEVLDTIDLIFQKGVDWKAFIQTLNATQAEHKQANLQIQAIENKGDGVVVVKLHANSEANKEAIHKSFMQRYQKALKAVEEKYKAQLYAKDKEIQLHRQQSANMYKIAETLAQRPITVEAKAIAGNNDVNDNSNNLNITGNITGSTISFGDINAQVSNQINQLPSATAGQADLKDCLNQLQKLIQEETKLTAAKQATALEELQALAKAAQNPQDPKMKKLAKQSMDMLSHISVVSGSIQMGIFIEKAWPILLGFFGL